MFIIKVRIGFKKINFEVQNIKKTKNNKRLIIFLYFKKTRFFKNIN